MHLTEDLEYVSRISPTLANARALQALTLQDLRAVGFEDPLLLADPSNGERVAQQLIRLRDHPEHYSGVIRDGELVAYMKQNEWLFGDELPFASGLRALWLKLSRLLRRSPATGQWGVFGLVASNKLAEDERTLVLEQLLRHSFVDSRGTVRTVNVVLSLKDSLLPIARKHGFVVLGEPNAAAGAPGLVQRRYQRLVPTH